MTNHIELLKSFCACQEAVDWYNGKDSREAWESCEHGDWLLWICRKLEVGRTLLVLAACDCARLSLLLVPEPEERPRLAIEAAEKWANDPTEDNMDATRSAVDASIAYAAYTGDAAAYAAGYAAHTAANIDYADDAAIYAAYATAAGARLDCLRCCADLVRKRIPWNLVEEAIHGRDR